MRNRSLIKAFGTGEESPGDRGGTSYSGHFSVIVNHIAVPPFYERSHLGSNPSY